MVSNQTPYYELYDEEKDIMIYGIKLEAIFSEGIEINSETINIVHQNIPDVWEKCMNSKDILKKPSFCTIVALWKLCK